MIYINKEVLVICIADNPNMLSDEEFFTYDGIIT